MVLVFFSIGAIRYFVVYINLFLRENRMNEPHNAFRYEYLRVSRHGVQYAQAPFLTRSVLWLKTLKAGIYRAYAEHKRNT